MPYSSSKFDEIIFEVLKSIKPQSFLDIGSGAGKYGKMIKKINSKIHSIAVEISKTYIKKFKLKSIYDEVWNISALNLIKPKYYNTEFDTIMIGDVIEHLKKSDGINLLNFLIYRCKWIILEFPYKYLQNSVNNKFFEAHISVWSKSDFESFERTTVYNLKKQRLVVLKGYLNNSSIRDVDIIIKRHYDKKMV